MDGYAAARVNALVEAAFSDNSLPPLIDSHFHPTRLKQRIIHAPASLTDDTYGLGLASSNLLGPVPTCFLAGVAMMEAGFATGASREEAMGELEWFEAWACVGIHPKARLSEGQEMGELREGGRLREVEGSRVVGIGEAGWDQSRGAQPREVQKIRLQRQIAATAREGRSQTPLILHLREANGMSREGEGVLWEAIPKNPDRRIVLHHTTLSEGERRKWAEAWPNCRFGAGIGVSSYNKSLANGQGLSRLVLETDAPYGPPRYADGWRWQRTREIQGRLGIMSPVSYPGLALYAAAELAVAQERPLREIIAATTQSVHMSLGLSPSSQNPRLLTHQPDFPPPFVGRQ